MATYYVRGSFSGASDSNAGTSAATAWKSLGKLLGAAGMASGDLAYVGAGIYREVVTIAMTSATVETKIIGDVTGQFTGDAGEVTWTAYTTNDTTAPSATSLLTLAGRDFLTFENFKFQFGSAAGILATTNTSTNINWTRCYFVQGGTGVNNIMTITSAANVALNWVIDQCGFMKASGVCINYTPVKPATADFNISLLIKNCKVIGGNAQVVNLANSTGANTFLPGGVEIRNVQHIGANNLLNVTTNWSTSIPNNVYNCFVFTGGTILNAVTLGQIIEDYNILVGGATPRTNVTAGVHSIADGSYDPLFYTGYEYDVVGANLKPFGMPLPGSPLLGFGNQAGSPTTDILGAARPSGFVKFATGTATSGAATTLTDSGATWGTNVFVGKTVKIISGTGSAQTKSINANTATVITVDGNWKTNPDSTSVYEVYSRANSSSGTATAGSTTTLTDANAVWGTNMWQRFTLNIDGGTGSPQTLLVISNTATVLTFAAATAPDATSTYKLFIGASENVINAGVGCYESSDTAIQDTITFLTSPNSWCLPGAGYQDFHIEVRAVATSITVYSQYDSAYSGTLPSMNIVNGGECGVANATATQVGAANTWEALTLSFTPTANGFITLRLVSATTTPTGNANFDQFIPFN